MKILITGANGLLGQHLVKLLLDETTYSLLATGRGSSRLPFAAPARLEYHSLDITDAVAVEAMMALYQPQVIVHTAAITHVDDCERDPINCWQTNVTATRFLINAAEKINARFIHISTDFVFDGLSGPYKETDAAEPVNYYGSSKLAAEKAVEESTLHYCIIRTVLVYGNVWLQNRSNIVSWVKDNLEKQQQIKVVADQWRTPTYVEDLAKGTLLVIEKNAEGIFHISGGEMMTPYDMGMATASYLNADASLIEKVNASTFTQPAKRPAITGFIIDKAKRELGYQPISFREGLHKMFS